MLLKCCCLLILLYGQAVLVTPHNEQLISTSHRIYMRQEETCSGIMIWPSRPFILTRDKRKGEIFPRPRSFVEPIEIPLQLNLQRRNCNLSTDGIPFAQGDFVICIMNWSIQFKQKEFLNNRIVGEQTVRHFVEDLEIIVRKALGHIGHHRRRQKRAITIMEEDANLDNLCDKGSSNFAGSCDQEVKRKPVQVDVKKKKKKKQKPRPVQVIEPKEVVEIIKKEPFDNPKSKEWNYVEPSKKEKVSSEGSPYGVTMVDSSDQGFVDPYVAPDGSRVQMSLAGGKIIESFAPQGFSHMLTSHDVSTCISQYDGFWMRDLMEYMGGDCWILGRFARMLYPCVYCKPGICHGHNRLFGTMPTCFPDRFSTHTAWLYCPHLNPGERFRKYSFNLAQSCGCRMC